ncbi:MAG: DUF1801 domain-containing protein [Anaerolineales bacterium]
MDWYNLFAASGFGLEVSANSRIRETTSDLSDTMSFMDKKSPQIDRSVKDFIASLGDEQLVKDSQVLLKMMQQISGQKPKLWNVGTIGFDTYHYKYDSGREGDGHVIGFYPRKGKITVYLMDGTARYSELLAKLGKHTTTGYCLYIKRLSDVESADP